MILEDDSSLNLLNGYDRNAIAENENVKPKFIIQPKRVTNMDLKQGRSNFGTLPEEIQLCPLELRPLMKKSSSSIETKWTNYEICEKTEKPKKTRIPRRPRQNNDDIIKTGNCNKTGDMYRNILGPTPDESILAGLQTVIDLCGLIDDCKEDTDHSPTTDTGSVHVYHRQEIPYPCTFETRVLATTSRQSNNASTDDANETFLTARDHSSRRGFVERPYGSKNLDGTKIFSANRDVSSDIVGNTEILQRSAVSRDNGLKRIRNQKNNSKLNDTNGDIDIAPPCDVCPQCVKEIERLQLYNTKLVSNEKSDVPYKISQSKKGNACPCDDICTKPLLKISKQTETKSIKVREEKEKKDVLRKKVKSENKKKCSTCYVGNRKKTEIQKHTEKEKQKEKIDICTECSPCVYEIENEGDSEMKDKDMYQRTSQSIRPTTSIEIRVSGSKNVLIEETKPATTVSSRTKENMIHEQTLTSSESLLNATETKITRECIATNLTCDKKICPNKKKKSTCSTCCQQKSKKKDVVEKSKMKDASCSFIGTNVNDCNVCDECIKKVEDSGKDFVMVNRTKTNSFKNTPNSSFVRNPSVEKSARSIVAQKETRDATTDSYDKYTEGLQTMAYRSSIPKNISEMKPLHSSNQPIRIETESNTNAPSGSGYRITSQTPGLRRSSFSQKSATGGNIELQEYTPNGNNQLQEYAPNDNNQLQEYAPGIQSINTIPSEMQNINKIPNETQTPSTELKSRSNVPLAAPTSSAMYRKSSGNQAGSRISIIVEEDIKPSSYQSVRSRKSSIVQPRSSESVPETSSDVETSETSFRPSRSLHDVKEDSGMFYERSPYKTVNGNDMASRSPLSSKCFPPVEIPPTFSKTSVVAIPSDLTSYSCRCKPSKVRGDRESSRNRSSHRSVPLRVQKSRTSSYIEPVGFDRRRKDFRRSGMQIPSVQPVIGMCTSQCAGDKLLDVRYAVVKISVFEDYTTYEIMKSSTVKPKKIPDCVEGIFVTKR